ncbi:MAG: hypothetical protein JW839_12600 [Candidatus Lokiarchaeota archaeon]|nr:hypothetical protein [Candidatus Lokiarchaeota archaeon]
MAPGDKPRKDPSPKDDSSANAPVGLDDLLQNIEKSKPLDELLNEVMDQELEKQFQRKEERKQVIIQELVNASKIYEKMPLERLAIKLKEDSNEILDLLEHIILNNEFTGIVISGKELIFNKIQRHDELDRKPFLVVTSPVAKPVLAPAGAAVKLEPIKRKKVDLRFKVLGEQPVVQVPVEREALVASAEAVPVAGQLQLKLVLANNSAKALDGVLVKFLLEGQLRLVRMKPAYAGADWSGEITIPSIPPGSSRRVLLYFSPGTCEPVGFDVIVQYQDAASKFIDETLNERVDIAPPAFTKKQAITKEHFHDIITHHLKMKGIKSYGIPAGLAATEAYLIIKEILITNEFEFVGEKFLEEKNQFLGWYYTGFKVGEKEDDFIVIGQVLNNKMEFFAMAGDGMQLLRGLTHLAMILREGLVERGTIRDESELVELVCPSCGGVLDVFPAAGELHPCKFCGAKLQF